MDMNELLEPFARMLEAVATPAAVRAIEEGGPAAAIWDEFVASGFLDALVPEEAGGAGLSLADVAPLWQALGRHAVPVPVADTMVARYLLAAAGEAAPEGPIALASAVSGGELVVQFGRVAEHVLIDLGDRLVLAATASASVEPTGVRGDIAARLRWAGGPQGVTVPCPENGLRPLTALVRAALIAGASARLLEMTVAYANDRVQFGKPIGRQQALQQNLAVMAEDVIAARIAVELAASGGLPLALVRAATAKSVTSAAAARIANTAHAVHGAIGISEEHDLQLFSRRLHGWRLADGSEGYWNRVLGEARLASPAGTVDWVREVVFA
jgi:alkylation response protein AidB-like acyl-CoA dehydrogenase